MKTQKLKQIKPFFKPRMNTDEAQIVLRSQAAVAGESGRGLPHSKTLARSSCTPRIYPK